MSERTRKILRIALSHFVACYAAVGVVLGSLIYASIPAVNVLGWGYYAVTWPGFVCLGAQVCRDAPPIPRWAFTLKHGAPTHDQ